MKPKSRSKARLLLGSCYFKGKRYFNWYFGGERFAKAYGDDELQYVSFRHQTPFIRNLKDVDMWLHTNKIKNLKLATRKVNKIIIHPGETFSYWKTLGNPTKRKGYVEGMVLFYGQFKTGIGGGLCQLSNLIYWITLHTPLIVTERHRHSYDVFPDANRTQPFGSGATCSYNYLDLKIYNPTNEPYQLVLKMDEEHLIGEWRTIKENPYTYQIYEKDHVIKQEYWGGYVRHNSIYRKVFNQEGNLIGDEFITENHALMMYQPFLEAVNDFKRCD